MVNSPTTGCLPIGAGKVQSTIGALPGVVLQNRPARVYPMGAAAAHVVGYVGHPNADELRQLASSGFVESDWLGRSGIEAWGEEQLAGKKGGSIQIVDQGGRVLRTIVQKRGGRVLVPYVTSTHVTRRREARS